MESFILFIICFFAIFMSSSAAKLIGIEQVVTFAYTPLIIFAFFRTLDGHFIIKKHQRNLLFIGLFAIFFKYLLGQDYIRNITIMLIIPAILCFSLNSISKRSAKGIRLAVILFFIAECFTSFYEYYYKINLFEWRMISDEQKMIMNRLMDDWEFRSSALLGHPLMNAMCVCIMMSFFITSTLSNRSKLLLFSMGYISLFCFNARWAIIVSTLLLIPFLIIKINQTSKNRINRKSWIVFVFISLIYLFYYLQTHDLGGRLLYNDLADDSTMTRIEVFSFYKYLNWNDLLFGSPALYEFIHEKLATGGVENGIIVMILTYGLILTSLILPTLVLFHYRNLQVYKKADRWLILAIFYLIGISNPNLAQPYPWYFWIFSYYAFRYHRKIL